MSKKKYLKQKDMKILLELTSEEICDFDCGAICSKKSINKIPYCCDIDKVIPVLYRGEFDYFNKRSDLWKEFKPRNKHERKLVDELESNQVMAKCKGPKKCDRRYRGFVCRNFPTYPYFNSSGKVVGLFFSRTLNGKCVLIDHPEFIRKKYIRDNVKFWNRLLELVPDELEFYQQFAKTSEKRMRSIGKEFIVMR